MNIKEIIRQNSEEFDEEFYKWEFFEQLKPKMKEDIWQFFRQSQLRLLSAFKEMVEEILNDYSNWLHDKGYIDSDYYTEEPKAVDAYLETPNKLLSSLTEDK